VRNGNPINTCYLPLSYSGNPGVNGVSDKGVGGQAAAALHCPWWSLHPHCEIRFKGGAKEEGGVLSVRWVVFTP